MIRRLPPEAHRARPAPRAGFTLIELVVVMGMILIVTSIVAPTFRVSPVRRVEGEAHQLATYMELARNRALANRQLVRVVFDEDALTYAAYVDHNRDGTIDEVEAEVNAFPQFGSVEMSQFVKFGQGGADKVPGDVSADAITLTDNKIQFSVQGVPEPWGTMGTVYIVSREDANAVGAVSLASSGSFKAWRWNATEGEWR